MCLHACLHFGGGNAYICMTPCRGARCNFCRSLFLALDYATDDGGSGTVGGIQLRNVILYFLFCAERVSCGKALPQSCVGEKQGGI